MCVMIRLFMAAVAVSGAAAGVANGAVDMIDYSLTLPTVLMAAVIKSGLAPKIRLGFP